uniref:DNA-directed RNA polymerase II subunit GRINL1A n=1 Tax=Anas platyrhynchos platyrhynchos TaxID=8840 RepID=A0A493TYI6_ANAPP
RPGGAEAAGMAAAGGLRGRSLGELREMLRRQRRLLADRKFIARLPDKGQKIADFAEKLQLAVLQEEELARTAELLSAVRLELRANQEKANASQEQAAPQDTLSREQSPAPSRNPAGTEAPEVPSREQEAECIGQGATETAVGSQRTLGDDDKIETVPKDQGLLSEAVSQPATSSHMKNDCQISQSNADDGAGGAGATDNNRDTLVDAFQKVTIADGDNSEKVSEKEQKVAKHKGNIFGSLHPKTPHYIEVLESRAKNPVIKRSKFRTNVNSSSRCIAGSPITTEERRLRDKKHLNDITAARLPPLHHAPAKLLSIEESIAIQIQQKEAYEEMQAKLAAQKLAERLNIKMMSFEPEGEAAMQYREVRDEDYFSAED